MTKVHSLSSNSSALASWTGNRQEFTTTHTHTVFSTHTLAFQAAYCVFVWSGFFTFGFIERKSCFVSATRRREDRGGGATLKSVTEMSTFSGTGHTTIPRYGFLIPGCQLWSCTTNSPLRHVHASGRGAGRSYLGAHASVPPGPHHPQLVRLPVDAHKHEGAQVHTKCWFHQGKEGWGGCCLATRATRAKTSPV